MSVPVMFFHLFLERLSPGQALPRVLESNLVMDGPEQVASFAQSGLGNGILVPIHFFHAFQASLIVKPGDHVLELASGPANQLIRMAQLNPQVRFTGLDASEGMLQFARQSLARQSVSNVNLALGDMCSLSQFGDASIDAVISTMSMHHLPDLQTLRSTFREVGRVLKPGGGVYLADFGRLKRRSTQSFFAYDRQREQSPHFTQNYAESLAAAFSTAEWKAVASESGLPLDFHETVLAPFMVILKTPDRRVLDDATSQRVRAMFDQLSWRQQRDFQNIARWFRLANYPLAFELG